MNLILSAQGTLRTWRCALHQSAFGPIADLHEAGSMAAMSTLGYLAVQIRQNAERERLAQEFASNQYFSEL